MSVFRKGLFAGKVAVVTGGATGIGRAITEELSMLGCKVVIASRNSKRLETATKELNMKEDSVSSTVCNIRNEDDVKSLVTTTLTQHGRLDFLVNNGGGQFPGMAASFSLKGWNAVIETNLTGTFLMCREVYNQWMERHGGVIVNIVADMFRGFPLMSHTGAARAAVENLTKSLAIEWASSGVRVNAVAPGVIYSSTARSNYSTDVFKLVRPNLPSKRTGSTKEVSSAVCFLLSPGASFISGATLRVDAGSSLYSPHMLHIEEHSNWPPSPGWNFSLDNVQDDGGAATDKTGDFSDSVAATESSPPVSKL